MSGKQSLPIADSLFSKDIADADGYTVHYGNFMDGDAVLDEVVMTVFRSPKSFTREDTVEISFHGSPFILQRALELLGSAGARFAEPGEFTRRAWLNGSMDLSQAEAVADLIASETAASHKLAMAQMRGGVSEEIGKLRVQLLDFVSLIELELDFGEEDVEFADRPKLLELVKLIQEVVSDLAETFRLGNAIKSGIQTVIAGRPNAGKSTLLNTLLQEERAIVSDIPGTTRDTIEEVLTIQGIKFRLVDTAGIREAQDQIEEIGVERTLEKVAGAAILVYLYDVVGTSPAEVEDDLSRLRRDGLEVIVVGNKADLRNSSDRARPVTTLDADLPSIFISAKTGNNIDELRNSLVMAGTGNSVLGEQVIISNARHYQALQKVGENLASAEQGLQAGLSSELTAIDIRHAIHHLGEITGEITTDEVLGNIFSKFCIGK